MQGCGDAGMQGVHLLGYICTGMRDYNPCHHFIQYLDWPWSAHLGAWWPLVATFEHSQVHLGALLSHLSVSWNAFELLFGLLEHFWAAFPSLGTSLSNFLLPSNIKWRTFSLNYTKIGYFYLLSTQNEQLLPTSNEKWRTFNHFYFKIGYFYLLSTQNEQLLLTSNIKWRHRSALLEQ